MLNNDRKPSVQEQIEFYDSWNTEFRKGRFDEIDSEISNRAVIILEKLMALGLNDPRILEVGCGTGWLTERLSDLGQVTAIDLSPRAIEIAHQRGLDAKLLCADIYDHVFGTASFDVVVCVETLFYVSDQVRLVDRMAEVLKDGGVLAVTLINKFVYERSSDVAPPEPGQIRSWLTPRQTRELLSPHFDVLTSRTVEPRGDLGILRLVNSYKVNAILGRLFSDEVTKRAKERLGLGGGIVMMARKKSGSTHTQAESRGMKSGSQSKR